MVKTRGGAPYHPWLHNGLLRGSALSDNRFLLTAMAPLMMCCHDDSGLTGSLGADCLWGVGEERRDWPRLLLVGRERCSLSIPCVQ